MIPNRVRVGITGHRASAFPPESPIIDICTQALNQYLTAESYVINLGGCSGIDLWVGDLALSKSIPIRLYLPFTTAMSSRYLKDNDRQSFNNQVNAAEAVECGPDQYSPAAFHVRNRKIVDNSDSILCFWNGSPKGGTYATIQYALSRGLKVYNGLDQLKEVTI